MALLSTYTEGIGMSPAPSRKQQIVVMQLLQDINNTFDDMIALPHCAIDGNDGNSAIPDICVYHDQDDVFPTMFIEVCSNHQKSSIIKKVTDLVAQYDIEEAFVYVLEKKSWHKITSLGIEEDDFSETLDQNLDDFIGL